MAHNPKLNVFIVTLKPKNKEEVTFREFFRQKYFADGITTDADIYTEFYKDVINALGNEQFNNDSTNKKVIGISNSEDSPIRFTINRDNYYIDGLIDGGPYGLKREYANISNKDQRKQIEISEAVLDKFYIMLSTPLNTKEGYLFVQSYTESSVADVIKKALQKVFLFDDKFNNPDISSYVPKAFVERFANGARVRLFSYDTVVGVPACLRENSVIHEGQSFGVRIEVTPKDGNIKPGTSKMMAIIDSIGKLMFNGTALGNTAKVFIESESSRRVNYDINKDLESIRPTIYLEDEGISIDATTGQLDYEALKKFCLSQLNIIRSERLSSYAH